MLVWHVTVLVKLRIRCNLTITSNCAVIRWPHLDSEANWKVDRALGASWHPELRTAAMHFAELATAVAILARLGYGHEHGHHHEREFSAARLNELGNKWGVDVRP